MLFPDRPPQSSVLKGVVRSVRSMTCYMSSETRRVAQPKAGDGDATLLSLLVVQGDSQRRVSSLSAVQIGGING
jgi:hypothetical protein